VEHTSATLDRGVRLCSPLAPFCEIPTPDGFFEVGICFQIIRLLLESSPSAFVIDRTPVDRERVLNVREFEQPRQRTVFQQIGIPFDGERLCPRLVESGRPGPPLDPCWRDVAGVCLAESREVLVPGFCWRPALV
jgi:hypothetical protein